MLFIIILICYVENNSILISKKIMWVVCIAVHIYTDNILWEWEWWKKDYRNVRKTVLYVDDKVIISDYKYYEY